MNKQEFMNYLKRESRASANAFIDSNNLVFQGEARAYQNASLLCENLDEPQKVKVPEFVADWIEEVKQRGCGLADALDCFASPIMPDNIKEWLEFNSSVIGCHHDHQELLARAWLDGYEIEDAAEWIVKIDDNAYFVDFFDSLQPHLVDGLGKEVMRFDSKEKADAIILLIGDGIVEKV